MKKLSYSSYVMYAFGRLLKALVGKPIPMPSKDYSHAIHATYTDNDVIEANEYASNVMLETGWTLGGYELAERSCFAYALQKASLMIKFLADKYDKGFAAPIYLFGYTRDKDGRGHVRIKAVGSRDFYFEPYGEVKYRTRWDLSAKEIARANLGIGA